MTITNSIYFSDGREVQLLNEVKKELKYIGGIESLDIISFDVEHVKGPDWKIYLSIILNGSELTYEYQLAYQDIINHDCDNGKRRVIWYVFTTDEFKEWITDELTYL